MRFPFRVVTDLEDATRNFEAIETRFGLPVYPAAPSNPGAGQMYFDSTLTQAGYWTGSAWTYF